MDLDSVSVRKHANEQENKTKQTTTTKKTNKQTKPGQYQATSCAIGPHTTRYAAKNENPKLLF